MRTIPLYFSVIVSIIIAYGNASIIFTGGVGKNGSTVAVRIYKIAYKLFNLQKKKVIFTTFVEFN